MLSKAVYHLELIIYGYIFIKQFQAFLTCENGKQPMYHELMQLRINCQKIIKFFIVSSELFLFVNGFGI